MSWHPAHGRHVRVSTLVLVVFLVLAGGYATMPDPGDPEAVAEFNKVNDPAEPANRAIFELNRGLDTAFLKPVATFYRDVIPQFFQDPINDILQGELDRALATAARFMVNSTIGILGVIDIATEMGLEGHDEDFGQTLAVWGMPEGPYVVLPLFGPSNPRDTIGIVVDFLVDPFNLWASNSNRDFAVFARTGSRAVDLRAIHMEALDSLEKTSLDYYATLRSLYRQRRADEISNGKGSANLPAPGLGQAPLDDGQPPPGDGIKTSEKTSRIR